jgi:hypothetical protein
MWTSLIDRFFIHDNKHFSLHFNFKAVFFQISMESGNPNDPNAAVVEIFDFRAAPRLVYI